MTAAPYLDRIHAISFDAFAVIAAAPADAAARPSPDDGGSGGANDLGSAADRAGGGSTGTGRAAAADAAAALQGHAAAPQATPLPQGTVPAVVRFTYTLRDADDVVLDAFHTELHLPVLDRPGADVVQQQLTDQGGAAAAGGTDQHAAPSGCIPQLTGAEALALACFGVCHIAYVLLPFTARVRLAVVRALPLTDAQLAFFARLFRGGLAEFYFLADLDLDGEHALAWACKWQAAQAGDGGDSTDAASAAAAAQALAAAAAAEAAVGGEVPAAAGDADSGGPGARVLVPMGGGKDSTLLMELLVEQVCGRGFFLCIWAMGGGEGGSGSREPHGHAQLARAGQLAPRAYRAGRRPSCRAGRRSCAGCTLASTSGSTRTTGNCR